MMLLTSGGRDKPFLNDSRALRECGNDVYVIVDLDDESSGFIHGLNQWKSTAPFCSAISKAFFHS